MGSTRQEDLINKNEAAYKAEFEQALLDGNLHAALTACITRGILQARQLHRIDVNLKLDAIDEVAKAIHNYASTFQGFGFNLDTSLTVLQAGSGMFGLTTLHPSILANRFFTFPGAPLDFKTTAKIGQMMQTAFGAPKNLLDERKQYHRTIKQSDVDNAKRIQDEYKEKIQRVNSSSQELQQQLKNIEEAEHRAKMSATGNQ